MPHNLHQQIYTDILEAGKHLMGEKPFGIDLAANEKILSTIADHPDLFVRCSSEFPYFPAAQRAASWAREGRLGRIMEARFAFHHSSDMDLKKALNWKRMSSINGEYGCMGDLGMHTMHLPFRLGWRPASVYAQLSNIVETRPDGKGGRLPCDTWDNASIHTWTEPTEDQPAFPLTFETKRMAPGQTDTWLLEVYGTQASVRFSTADPKVFSYCLSEGKEQGWTRLDLGSQSCVPSITGGIFEFGFSDAFQQMWAAFVAEYAGVEHPFTCVTPEETRLSHRVLTAALQSHRESVVVKLDCE